MSRTKENCALRRTQITKPAGQHGFAGLAGWLVMGLAKVVHTPARRMERCPAVAGLRRNNAAPSISACSCIPCLDGRGVLQLQPAGWLTCSSIMQWCSSSSESTWATDKDPGKKVELRSPLLHAYASRQYHSQAATLTQHGVGRRLAAARHGEVRPWNRGCAYGLGIEGCVAH